MVKPGQPLTIDGKPHPTESPPPHWNWQPPRNIINLDRLPPLPLLVDYACWALFSDANIQRGYRDAHQPSGHSLQSLAFLGDSLLQAAATKALMGVTAPAYRSCLGDLTVSRVESEDTSAIEAKLTLDRAQFSRWQCRVLAPRTHLSAHPTLHTPL